MKRPSHSGNNIGNIRTARSYHHRGVSPLTDFWPENILWPNSNIFDYNFGTISNHVLNGFEDEEGTLMNYLND